MYSTIAARLQPAQLPMFEPELEAIVGEQLAAGRLSFTHPDRIVIGGDDSAALQAAPPIVRADMPPEREAYSCVLQPQLMLAA